MSTTDGDGSTTRQTYAAGCIDMIDIFTSCTSKIDDLTTRPHRDQASCYCCRTSGRRVIWADQLGSYASSCADWAITAEPETAYVAAKGFESFCASFTDVCATTTNDGVSRETDSRSSNREGIVTVTHRIIEGPPTLEAGSERNNLSKGAIAGIAVGTAVSLLVLSGIFIWCWKKKQAFDSENKVPHTQPTEIPGNSIQQQPMSQMPYGQQPPDSFGPPQFNRVYAGNDGYHSSSFSTPPPGQTPFIAELPAGKDGVGAVEAAGTEIKR